MPHLIPPVWVYWLDLDGKLPPHVVTGLRHVWALGKHWAIRKAG